MEEVTITWFDPCKHAVEEKRGLLAGFDANYFRLVLPDNRTFSIPTGFVISATLDANRMEESDSPQSSALGSAMQKISEAGKDEQTPR